MNIPNFLSLLRIILVPVFVIFLIQSDYDKALIIFVVAGVTDALDGALARLLKCQTTLGAYLDPIADKLLLAASYITLAIFGLIPGWLAVIVISRDFMILTGIAILNLMSIAYEVKPAIISKVTTALQIATIFFALLHREFFPEHGKFWLDWLFWATAVITVLSCLVYIIRGVRILNQSGTKEDLT